VQDEEAHRWVGWFCHGPRMVRRRLAESRDRTLGSAGNYSARMLALVVVKGPDRGRVFRLPEREPQLVGRSSEALHLTDPTVSRRHAELTPDMPQVVDGDGDHNALWIVRDLASRHGTFVNGVRIAGPVTLRAGDRLRCGDTELLALREGVDPPTTLDDGPPNETTTTSLTAQPTKAEPSRTSAKLLAALMEHATEPTEVDAFLADAAATVALYLRLDVVAVRARDPRLESFVAPSHGERIAPHAPLALVRSAIDSGEMIASREGHADGLVIAAPFGGGVGARGALVARRSSREAPTTDEVECLAHATQCISLALAARGARDAQGEQHRLALIGETVAALSHSIKNMLQGMRFGADAVELALSRGELARAQEGWPVLQRNLDRIHALALNMLAWAKERPLEPEPCDLHEIVREVRELLAPAAGRRRVGTVLSLDDALPPVSIDTPALHQALTNLVLNALEAAPERTGLVTIATRYDAASDEVIITVRDNGPGIPDAVRARLFEPFVSSKGQRGTGLGLAVARKIAERHGGRLDVVESSRSGTAFALTLPASGEGHDPSETRAPRGMPPEAFPWKFA
jgi:two-component system NtrC family sensor kinase